MNGFLFKRTKRRGRENEITRPGCFTPVEYFYLFKPANAVTAAPGGLKRPIRAPAMNDDRYYSRGLKVNTAWRWSVGRKNQFDQVITTIVSYFIAYERTAARSAPTGREIFESTIVSATRFVHLAYTRTRHSEPRGLYIYIYSPVRKPDENGRRETRVRRYTGPRNNRILSFPFGGHGFRNVFIVQPAPPVVSVPDWIFAVAPTIISNVFFFISPYG